MKDIDFEELDRAVSSLIGKPGDKNPDDAASSQAAQDEPAVSDSQSVPVKTVVKTEEKPDVKDEPKPDPKPEQAEKAVVESSPLISSGRGKGVYIDGVRPGGASKPTVPLPSKSGKTLQPLGADIKPEEPKKEHHEKSEHHHGHKPHEDEPKHHEKADKEDKLPDLSLDKLGLDEKSVKESAEEPESKKDGEPAKNETKWPDPIDVYNQKQGDEDDAGKEDEETKVQPSDPSEMVHSGDAPDPLSQAPFVAGATDKVEKRPLGAYSGEPEQKEEPKEPQEQTDSAKPHPADTQVPAQAAKLPPELENDVVAVELSEAATGTNASKSPEQHEDELDDIKQEEHDENHPEDHHKEESSPGHHNTAVAATAVHQTLSIPQQYREEHEPAEHKEHQVFDTKEYHPPITAHQDQGHKYTIWWIALALVVLIVTAVAFGYWVMNGL